MTRRHTILLAILGALVIVANVWSGAFAAEPLAATVQAPQDPTGPPTLRWRQKAFFSTPLDALMRWNGIKTMVIVGIGAEVGVVPALMTASNRGCFRWRSLT